MTEREHGLSFTRAMPPSPLRAIPSVEKVLRALGPLDLPRPVVTATVRRGLAVLRAELHAGEPAAEFKQVVEQLRGAVERLRESRLQPVINATGIPLHTNLGRAPLAPAAIEALVAVAGGYSNLEYDLASGERGGRAAYLEGLLALVTGAEAATVVNNCAAALVLMLRHFTRGAKKEVVISRGELVQIGGGFRVPEIMAASGARLREVGTTNRTSVEDYVAALGPETALVLCVHRANFYLGGFVGSPSVAEIVAAARKRRVPVAEDLGSGALAATEPWAGAAGHERTPLEAVRDGVEAVCFSGDKLLGGPQAGIVAGHARSVAAMKREPFFRALRCDKLVLSALEATVALYLADRESEIPALALLRAGQPELRERAERLWSRLAGLPLDGRVRDVKSRVGGGTMPRTELPSVALELRPANGLTPGEFASRLRRAATPVVGYLSGDRYRLDLRTVFPAQDATLEQAVRAVFDESADS